jgi:murein DD-endopeptidase MepM/ murein hydrolase activator NlpD
MTDAIAKSLEDSISKRIDDNIQDLMKQMGLKPIGREEMIQDNIRGGTEGGELETAGGAVEASELYKETGANLEQWDIFRNSIALIESGGRYSAMGGSGKHYDGRYQMGAAAKKDGSKIAGIVYPGHSDNPNDHSRVSFRNNSQLQELLFTGYTIANHRYLMRNPKYKSASVERKLQILGYAHNQGMGGAENWLNTGVVGADGFGTKGTKYTDLIAKNFKAKKSGGRMELAQGAISIPTGISGKVGSFGVMDPTPNSRPGSRGSTGYASDSGLDIIGKTGDSVVSPVDGTLLYSEEGHTSWKDDSNPDMPGHQPQHSFLIQLSKPFKYGGKNVKYAYGTHLSSLGSSFANKSGVPIKAGQFIGRMGVANKVPHLHLGLLENRAQSSPSDWLSNVEVKQVLTGSRFHGGLIPKDGEYNLHEGEFVVDKDSVKLFGKSFIATINDLENQTQLKQKVGSLIGYLSYITGYELGGQQEIEVEPQIVYVEVEKAIPVPVGGGGYSGSGSNGDSTYDALYAQG